jgi:hypothetical protein
VQPSGRGSYLIDYAIGWTDDNTDPTMPYASLSFDAGGPNTTTGDGARGGSRLGAVLDMTEMELRRGYIHDTLSESTAASIGGKGIALHNTKGLSIEQHRIERVSDTCLFIAVGDGTTTPPDYRLTVKQTVLLGCLADDINQQSGFELIAETAGIGGQNLALANGGQVAIRDLMSMGAHWAAYRYIGLSSDITRSVLGGATQPIGTPAGLVAEPNDNAAFSCKLGAGIPSACCTALGVGATCAMPIAAAFSGPANGDNLIVFNSQSVGDTAAWSGFLRNSLLVGNPHGLAVSLRQLGGLFGVFHDRGEVGQVYILRANADGTQKLGVSLVIEDTVLSAADATVLTHTEYTSGDAQIQRLELRRTTVLAENPVTPTGFLSNTDAASVEVQLEGFMLTGSTATGSDDLGIDSNTPVRLEDVCVESAALRTNVYDGDETATSLAFDELAPVQTDDLSLRAFVQDPTDTAICERAKPLTLGLTELGVQHLMLGDFVVEQMENWSSSLEFP